MRFMKVSIIVLLMALQAVVAFAEESESKDEKTAGKPDPAAKVRREYQEKAARFNFLEGRISGLEKEVMHLAIKKNAEKDPKVQKEIMDQMVALVEDRNKAAEQYNSLKTDLAYRFPSQGEALDRSYRTQSKKSVEEIEGSIGLDELLTRTKKMVDKKYAPFIPAKQVNVPAASSTVTVEDQHNGRNQKAAVQETSEEEKPKKLRLER
jgi:hypothetical protein